MDRSTTKSEYKAFMRKWRSVIANCGLPAESWKRDPAVQDEGRRIAFSAVFKVVPPVFFEFQVLTRSKTYRDLSEPHPSTCMKMNSEAYCPNSYPHKTRNP